VKKNRTVPIFSWIPMVIVFGMILAGCGSGQKSTSIDSEPAPFRSVPEFHDVTLRGEMGTRLAAATANLLTRFDRYPLESYRASAAGTPGALWWDWPGDQIGRMLSAMHVAEGNGWTTVLRLREAVAEVVLPLQTGHGNFGPELPLDQTDARLISGNAFALRGLMDAYEDTGEERFLEAGRRLGRYFEATFETWKEKGEGGPVHEFYGHCLDGLVKLYELGGDPWALDLAERIGARAGRTSHTHHSLSLYRGVIDLFRVTGDTRLLDKAADYLKWCRECRIVTGGLPENMPSYYQDEGCALADYLVVNLMMFSATGKDEFLDDAEHVLVNHFFMNQFHTGGFGHRLFGREGMAGLGRPVWERESRLLLYLGAVGPRAGRAVYRHPAGRSRRNQSLSGSRSGAAGPRCEARDQERFPGDEPGCPDRPV